MKAGITRTTWEGYKLLQTFFAIAAVSGDAIRFSAVIYFLRPSQSRVAPELRCCNIPKQITSISQTHYQTSKHICRIKSIATTHTNTDVNETNKILISAMLEVYREHGKVVIEGFSQEKKLQMWTSNFCKVILLSSQLMFSI